MVAAARFYCGARALAMRRPTAARASYHA
eukprot:SAG31_NODE_17740_length_659_cov_1.246429_1_plen_28_part_10